MVTRAHYQRMLRRVAAEAAALEAALACHDGLADPEARRLLRLQTRAALDQIQGKIRDLSGHPGRHL
jgi:hypothetical protein